MCGNRFAAKLPPVSSATTQSKESNMKRKLGMAFCTAAIASLALTASASADGPITLTPANHDFGNQAVGTTSAVKTVTLNVPCHYVVDLDSGYGSKFCSAPGKIDSIDIEGPFTQTNDCVLPIVNNRIDGSVDICTISVRFSPTADGPATGAIQLASWGQANQYTVPLTGTGFTPAPPPENGTGGNGGNGSAGKDNGSGSSAGVTGKKCKKAQKGSKAGKAKKCAKKVARR
jgi:hypothetical protein